MVQKAGKADKAEKAEKTEKAERAEKTGLKKAERTRKQLLDAALRVISRKGYTAATVDEIVQEAGVSKGVAYYHFESKAAMASDILDYELEDLITEFESKAQAASSAGEALSDMLEAFASRLYTQHEFARFFMTGIWREGRVWSGALFEKTQQLVGVIAGQLARGQREGVIRSNVDPSFAAVGIVGMVLTETMCYVGPEGEPNIGAQEFVERIYDFAHHAVVRAEGLQ